MNKADMLHAMEIQQRRRDAMAESLRGLADLIERGSSEDHVEFTVRRAQFGDPKTNIYLQYKLSIDDAIIEYLTARGMPFHG